MLIEHTIPTRKEWENYVICPVTGKKFTVGHNGLTKWELLPGQGEEEVLQLLNSLDRREFTSVEYLGAPYDYDVHAI